MENRVTLGSIQKTVWDGRIPLEIVLVSSESRTFDQTDPYLVCPLVLKHSARQDANPLL